MLPDTLPAQNALSRRCSRRLRPPLATDARDEFSQQGGKRGQVSSAVVRILTTSFSLPDSTTKSEKSIIVGKSAFFKKNLMSELGFFSSGQKHHLKAFPRLQDDFCAGQHLGEFEVALRSLTVGLRLLPAKLGQKLSFGTSS